MAFDADGNYIPDLKAQRPSFVDRISGVNAPMVGNNPYARARMQQLQEQRGQPAPPELTAGNALEYDAHAMDPTQMPSYIAAQERNKAPADQVAGTTGNMGAQMLVQALREKGAAARTIPGQANPQWQTPDNMVSGAGTQ